MAERYVVLGLALARSAWFRSVSQWAHTGAIPVEFVKCVSAAELRAQLASGRPFSALLVDGALPALDRDLIAQSTDAGSAVIVVDDLRITRDWTALGASAVINPVFERRDLLDVLQHHAAPLNRGDQIPGEPTAEEVPAGWRGRLALVCGPGGTGASTTAVALAQGLADDVHHGGMVLLADLALHAEQAMLHDARDVVPGIQEVVDAHRTRRPAVEEIRRLTFSVPMRRYELLLGLRRARHWSTLRPRAVAAALDSLVRGWRVVVADCDGDLEGEAEGGSADVEDRHSLARTAAARADLIFAVGHPGMKGVHSLVRLLSELIEFGVEPARLVPVINRAPKHPRARSETAHAIAELVAPQAASLAVATPVFVPDHRRLDDLLRDGARLPSTLAQPLAGAFAAVSERLGSPVASPAPVAVARGSLAGLGSSPAAERPT